MSSATLQPTTDPAESLARIIEGLCEAIAAVRRSARFSPIKRLASAQLRRFAGWFAALMAEFQCGLLAAARLRAVPLPPLRPCPPRARMPPQLLKAPLRLSTPADAGEGGLSPGGTSRFSGRRLAALLAALPQARRSRTSRPDVGDPAGAGALYAATQHRPSAQRPRCPAPPLLRPPARSPLPIPATPPFSLTVRTITPGRSGGRRWRRLSRGAAGAWSVSTAAAVSAAEPPRSQLSRDGLSATANARLVTFPVTSLALHVTAEGAAPSSARARWTGGSNHSCLHAFIDYARS